MRTQAPRLTGARIGTIPLPVIAAPAHPQLPLTARTVQQAVAGNANRPTSSPHQAWVSTRVPTHGSHTLPMRLSAMRDDALAIWMVPKPLDVEGIGRLTFASACPTKECQRFQGIPHQGGLAK